MADLDARAGRLRSLLRLALLVIVVDVVIAIAMSGGRPARPSVGAETLPPPTTVPVARAGVVVIIHRVGGVGHPTCFLAASTPTARVQGLRGRRTVAPYAGLALIHPLPTATGVTAAGVTIPFTVAYVNGIGTFVSAAATTPCPSGVACPAYPPAAPYRLALEVPTRTFPGLGLAHGSTAQVVGSC